MQFLISCISLMTPHTKIYLIVWFSEIENYENIERFYWMFSSLFERKECLNEHTTNYYPTWKDFICWTQGWTLTNSYIRSVWWKSVSPVFIFVARGQSHFHSFSAHRSSHINAEFNLGLAIVRIQLKFITNLHE